MKAYLFGLLCLIFTTNSLGADVKLAWDVHADTAVTGYKVYWGTASRTYTSNAPVAGRLVNTYTVTGLGTGTWFFAVTAIASVGESGYSNEVSKAIAPTPPGNLTITSVTASTSRWSTIIQWATNLDASCRVLLGTSPSSLNLAWQGSGLHTQHSATLESLKRKTTYYYKVESVTMDGRSAQSEIASFRTP